jgi:acyl transferase domain-containing protein
MTDPKSDNLGDIAVVGMAGRFPQAADCDEFWANLRSGRECISFFSDEELLDSGVDPALLSDPNYVKAWGWMDGVDLFDAGFFDITAREAEITDPQIRLLLECAWESLENSGCDPERYPGRIGVFAGSSMMFYLWQNIAPTPKLLEEVGFVQAWIVNDRDFVATRVNYKLDLKGPGMTVQTACSTSLVSIHLGIQSLLSGESDMVLAGGVSAPTPYKEGYHYMEGGTFSPDGHVRTFDAKAKGMLGGNGMALVALKRLEDALADGDHIRAVIKGTALNNDGIDKVTYTAPSVDGQSQVILDALDVAGIEPASISYVEAHGTGTPLGDPIEITALTQAWRTKSEEPLEKGRVPIGAVKTNIGHLDTAAGVAGVVKTILAMEHREIPPSLHFESANPEIDFAASPFFVNTELRPWDTDRLPRRATVSSLGMGGTNAHAILEEAPELPPTSESRAYQLLLCSARSEAALDATCERLADHLEGPGADQKLADVAFTTQVGRKGFQHRRIVVARDTADGSGAAGAADAIGALRGRDAKRTATGATMRSGRPVAFLFSGQGSQYANMARGLYESEAVFREELDRCCELATPSVGLDLRTLLFPEEGGEEAAGAELQKTQYTQPALFVVEYALARLLASWGIEPDAMLGHSIGEYVAAALADVFSLEDALALVAARGRLIGGLPEGGGMMAVHRSEAEVKRLLPDGLWLATVNAPELCVVSGPLDALDRLEKELEPKGVSTRRLHTSHAFHSGLMDPILDEFRAVVAGVTLRAPERPVVSCSTGTWLTDAEATDPDYWVRHVREAVRFSEGVRTLLSDVNGGDRILLEVGPGQALASLAPLTAMEVQPNAPIVATTRHPRDEKDDQATLLRALGELWIHGADVDWNGFHAAETRRRVMLPTYPFERRRYWIERPAVAAASGAVAAPERKNADMADWFHVPSWKRAAPALALAQDEAATRWLVLTDGGPFAGALVARAEASGKTVYTVRAGRAGSDFERTEASFTVDPAEPDHYRRVLDALAQDGGEPTEIVHLWSVAEALGPPTGELDAPFFSLLFLAQALSGRDVEGGIRVDVVTTGLHDVLGDRPAAPDRATVLGPCMSTNLELAGISARSIDLEHADEGALDLLLTELEARTEQPVLALHAGNRWSLTYEETHLPPAESVVERGATVLITGGLGGIGLTLAEELARSAQAKLVLVSRSGLPDEDAWDAWIQEHGEDDRTSAKIQRVRELRGLGAEVMVAAADGADVEAMRAVVAAAVERFGSIDGAIHAAGIAGSGIVELKTRETAGSVLDPKVRGALVLREVLADQEPAFVLLCSSISSICVGLGQIDYFAANAFMDALAHWWNRDTKTHVVSVNWDAWQEVGMAVDTAVPDEMKADRAASLRLGIAPGEGCEAFRRILATDLPQVVVSPRDLTRRDDYVARFDLRPAAVREEAADEEAAKAPTRATSPRPSLSTDFVAPEGSVQEAIAALWADLLGLEAVGVKDNFFELGGNSLVMMQVNVRLRTMYGVSLPIRELFEIPEVGLLAERMEAISMVTDPGPGDDTSEDVEEFTL